MPNDVDWNIWHVEKSGRVFARLENARVVEMFWVAYAVVDLTASPEDRRLLFSPEFWHQVPLPSFRHLPTGAVCAGAFAGGLFPTPERPEVVMRALNAPPT